MRAFLSDFFVLCDFPDEARSSLLEDYDRLMSDSDCRDHFEACISDYEQRDTTDFYSAYTKAIQHAERLNMSPHGASLLIFAVLARHLREMYAARGYSDKLWLDTMLDFRTKLMECRSFYGDWGMFVPFWYDKFFTMERFALGRLQYQLAPYYATKEPYTAAGVTVEYSKDRALELHIPANGPLSRAAVEASYAAAYEFFMDTEYVHNGIMICECSSWLLYPGLCEVLDPKSNVVDFSKDFEITLINDDLEFEDCWRVFGKIWDKDAEALPKNTDMQRRIAKRLAEGKPMGAAVGVSVYDGKNILTRKVKR